jgi:hypothetical protein
MRDSWQVYDGAAGGRICPIIHPVALGAPIAHNDGDSESVGNLKQGGDMAAVSSFYCGIEAGGTKVICAGGETPQTIQASTSICTTTPPPTLSHVIAFFQHYAVQGVGLAA